jgi:ABC-type transport system substrate-binding protein
VPVVPLTVLNNTTTPGLAESAAARFQAAGWPIALVGNFAGRIPSTTVYYTPGNTTQQRAAQALATQFKGIHRVMSRYSGLPPTPPGLVVVLTPDWTG